MSLPLGRAVLLCVAAFLPLIPTPQEGLGDFLWLEGAWEREARSGTVIERWRRTDAGLVGEGAVSRGGVETPDESLILARMGDDVFYIAKPRQNTYAVAFRLVSRDEGRFVFENTDHDFPQRIIYVRTSDDSMTVTIEGPGDGGAPRQVEFRFVRRP